MLVVLAMLAVLGGMLAGCGDGDEGSSLSFVLDGERWSTTSVSVQLEELIEPDGTVEVAIRLVASDATTGERLTLWSVSDWATNEGIVGTHPVRVFGSLAGFGGVAPRPVTNACSSNDPAAASGSLSIEAHDPSTGLIAGSFIANVCAVGEPDTTATLGDGRFRVVRDAG